MKSEPRAPLLEPSTVHWRDIAADPLYRALRKRAIEGEGHREQWPPGTLGNMPPGTWSKHKPKRTAE
jgi:hypothetical protein